MKTYTPPKRQMLRRIYTLSQVAGWAMILMGVLGVFGAAYTSRVVPQFGTHDIFQCSIEIAGEILVGLIVLAMAQFIRYVVEENTEPGWFLRNAPIILCLFALFLLLTGCLHSWPQLRNGWELLSRPPGQPAPMLRGLGIAGISLLTLLPHVTKVLCVLGIAAMLRTVLPILAESKTLA